MTFLDSFQKAFGDRLYYSSALEILKRADSDRLLGISSTTDVMRQLNRIDPEMAMFILGFIGSGDVPALLAKEKKDGGLTYPTEPWTHSSPPKTAVVGDIWVQATSLAETYTIPPDSKAPPSYAYDGTTWRPIPIKD
jgi:hypothetical protein